MLRLFAFTKTIENKRFIHYLKQFPQTLTVCFVIMPTSKHNYQCFLILVQSFLVLVHFQESLIVYHTN